MGLDYDELFPGRFLKSAEFKGKDVTYTIKSVVPEELEGDKGNRTRGVISFHETQQQLVLNKTNGECIKAMFGRNVDDWIGKRVTFWPAPYVDNVTHEVTTAIRVRGSADIAADLSFVLRLHKKKPTTVKLKRIGAPVDPAAGLEQMTAEKLSTRLSELAMWLTNAKPGNPHIEATRQKIAAIEHELEVRKGRPETPPAEENYVPPPPPDDYPLPGGAG